MSRPHVPGLSDDWADKQLTLDDLLAAGHPCGSCTTTMTLQAQVGRVRWECDPARPGCPLRDVPEQSR